MNKWQRWRGVMKAYPFEEKRLAKWEPPYIVQPKYDGIRCRAVPLDSGDFLLLSSEENPIFSVPHINEELKHLPHQEYDGELYVHGASFEEIVSITSRTVNLHPDHRRMQFHIFDLVSESPQTERISTLYRLTGASHWLPISPFWIADDLEDVVEIYDHIVDLGYEGIIVRHFLAPYERKRSTLVMKFKPKKEDEYVIEGFQEEISINGAPKGRLGALICRSGDGQLFNVGTGFNDEMRTLLWAGREILKGKVARVKYQHLTSGKKVPRFPVFVEVVDGNPNIKEKENDRK